MKIYQVSEIIRELKGCLEGNFPECAVTGQISNLYVSSAGHVYFTLKDAEASQTETLRVEAQLRVVMFRGPGSRLKFRPEEGLEVVVLGRVSLYEPRGELQLVAVSLEPRGIGALQLAFEQLKKKLEGEGLFESARKRPLPYLPRRIGIVTSPTGAVIHDMIHVLTRRFPNIEILLCPVAVQGEKAAPEIAEGIRCLDQREDIDLIIVGRGGGSVEDLWAFNTEQVARAIAAARRPVISAVGHETDFTIADFVADLRAPTPSAAAELAVPVKRELHRTVEATQDRLIRAMEQRLEQGRLGLGRWRALLRDPRRLLEEWTLRLDHQALRMATTLQHRVALHRQKLTTLEQGLTLLHPRSMMRRGFAVVRLHGASHPLKNARDAKVGDSLDLMLYEGGLEARVTGVSR